MTEDEDAAEDLHEDDLAVLEDAGLTISQAQTQTRTSDEESL